MKLQAAKSGAPYAEVQLNWGDGVAGMKGAGAMESELGPAMGELAGLGDQATAVGPTILIRRGEDLITLVISGVPDGTFRQEHLRSARRAADEGGGTQRAAGRHRCWASGSFWYLRSSAAMVRNASALFSVFSVSTCRSRYCCACFDSHQLMDRVALVSRLSGTTVINANLSPPPIREQRSTAACVRSSWRPNLVRRLAVTADYLGRNRDRGDEQLSSHFTLADVRHCHLGRPVWASNLHAQTSCKKELLHLWNEEESQTQNQIDRKELHPFQPV